MLFKFYLKRYQNIIKKCDISYSEIIDITKFLLINTFFKFDGKFYHQIFGTPMGSPDSPLFGDICMEYLEESCLNILKEKQL